TATDFFDLPLRFRTIFSFWFDQMKIVLAPADVHIWITGVFLFGAFVVGFNVPDLRPLVLDKAENGILRSAHRFLSFFNCLDCYKSKNTVNQSVRTYKAQRHHSSGTSSGTYVRIESPENTDILVLTSTSIPRKPRTRRPAALVTLLQYSRL